MNSIQLIMRAYKSVDEIKFFQISSRENLEEIIAMCKDTKEEEAMCEEAIQLHKAFRDYERATTKRQS